MVETGGNSEKAGSLPESKGLCVIRRRRRRGRREGSLSAALAQSMALAVVGTAGAYPSWVLVSGRKTQIVLGAAWAIHRLDPAPGTLLLGSNGAPLMLAIAFCCLFSVLSGSLALTLDFLGWRRRRRPWAPLFHGITALLIACAAALGSCLLAVIRGRIYTKEELQVDDLSAGPGQGLFLAFLACILAATATGLSCMSPARVESARCSWDLGRPEKLSFFPSRVRAGEFTDTSTVSFSLQNKFGLEDSSMNDDTASENADHYDCRNHLERSLSSVECPPEKRRRQQEAKERGQEWPQELLQGENRCLAEGLESASEEKVCSSGT